ncbi:MAG: hypothetical protein B7733_15785 [Myxococcales bacterium FL481]|nr:MAG: hypothetical protein B7733_15785 [Myxococcales bacterium FL481]
MTLPAEPSVALISGFVALTLALAAGFVWWTGRYLLAGAWLVATGLLAWSGGLAKFELPPRIMVVFVPACIGLCYLARREGWWRRPVGLLIGYQAFRIPVELLIYQAANEGVAPPQLTWSGMNPDVWTGITALLLFPFAHRLPRWSLVLWNIAGVGLLLNVVTVAVLSMPTSIQRFEPDNVWIGFFPFHWLPLMGVMMAALGHFMLFVRLRHPNDAVERSETSRGRSAGDVVRALRRCAE